MSRRSDRNSNKVLVMLIIAAILFILIEVAKHGHR